MSVAYCKTCEVEKDNSEFSPDELERKSPRCRYCINKRQREIRQNNIASDPDYYKDYNTARQPYAKQYRETHQEETKTAQKRWKNDNIEYVKEYNKKQNKKYHEEHKEEINAKKRKQYKEDDKKEQIATSERARYKNDSSFRLRKNLSRYIRGQLKKYGTMKNQSFIKALGQDYIEKLRQRIEMLWSHPDNLDSDGNVWMAWGNHGVYNRKTWKDNDPSTWVWNIDHIVPCASLPSSEMDEVNFQLCWAIENMRPFSAKQNIIDGDNRSEEDIIDIKNSIFLFLNTK